MKKNLFNNNYNNSSADKASLKACDPCATECKKINVKINGTNTSHEFELSIDINKPPADDLFYLWGGMTIFWVSIGAYVLYISSKFTQLRER